MRFLPLAATMALAACTPIDQSFDDDDGSDCGDTPPRFDSIAVSDADTITIKGEERRAVQVAAQVDDDDGDLHVHRVLVWYDEFIDGAVSGVPKVDIDVNLSPDKPCEVDFATLGALIPMGDGDVPFGTELEWGMVIYDAAGNPSDGGIAKLTVFRTPVE